MREVRVINPITRHEIDKIPVAAYCRVSSKSDEQRRSFSAQVKEYTVQIQSNKDWLLAGIYADSGITGTSATKRPEFQRLIEDCRQGKIKRVLVKSISRFARNTQECLEYLRELKALGVSVYFEEEHLDTGAISSEMMIAVLGSLAQEESASISNNMRWSLERRMQTGEFNTCFAPFGYRLKEGQLHMYEKEAELVRWIFNSYINGMSRTDIARYLTEQSIFTRGNKEIWTKRTIDYILANERYMGDALLQKKFTTEACPHTERRNKGEVPQYYVERANPAIISREIYLLANAMKQKRIFERAQPFDSPLKKKIYCAECGAKFQRKCGASGLVSWVCYKHNENKDVCPTPPQSEITIQNAFLRMFHLLKHNEWEILHPMLRQLERLREKSFLITEDINQLNLDMAKVSDQLHAITKLRAKGFLETDAFLEKQNELNFSLRALQEKRTHAFTQNASGDDTLERTQELIEIIQNAPEDLASIEDGEVFSMMVDKVIIDRHKRIVFRLINGLELVGAEGERHGQE